LKEKTNKNLARNNIKNNEKAITLIALVVTIIVLIILAGVSINLVLGNNGIITKARDARSNFQRAAEEEQTNLDNLYAEMNEKIDGTSNPGGQGGSENSPQQGKSGYAGESYNDPYVPTGFNHVGSEDWNHGYTIQDDLGNQFVWVPCSTADPLPEGVVRFQKTLPASNDSSDPNYKYNQYNYTLHPSGEPTETTTGVNAEDASVAAIRNSVRNLRRILYCKIWSRLSFR